MNNEFVRLYETELLEKLLQEHDPSLKKEDYVLGIPKHNLNPLTTFVLGNTYIELVPRNPVPNSGSIKTYYNRVDINTVINQLNHSKMIEVDKEVFLYEILDQLKEAFSIDITETDVYNTSIKEFPPGTMHVVLLMRPESYRYTGQVKIMVNVAVVDNSPFSFTFSTVVQNTIE